jgi:hypothetical protein
MKTFFDRKPYRMTAPLGCLLVYLLLAHGALPSLVLCFGSGGHIAVEKPHSPINHPTPQSQDRCLDVQLFMEKPEAQTLVVASSSALQAFVSFLAVAATFLQPFTLPWRSAILSPSVFSSIPPLALLRPVILRI